MHYSLWRRALLGINVNPHVGRMSESAPLCGTTVHIAAPLRIRLRDLMCSSPLLDILRFEFHKPYCGRIPIYSVLLIFLQLLPFTHPENTLNICVLNLRESP